jgi:hypothetical protein
MCAEWCGVDELKKERDFSAAMMRREINKSQRKYWAKRYHKADAELRELDWNQMVHKIFWEE